MVTKRAELAQPFVQQLTSKLLVHDTLHGEPKIEFKCIFRTNKMSMMMSDESNIFYFCLLFKDILFCLDLIKID
jgi:hypothetical protein